MINILNTSLIIIGILSTFIGIVGTVVGVWALATHREKKYIEQRTIFEEQLKRVQKELKGGANKWMKP